MSPGSHISAAASVMALCISASQTPAAAETVRPSFDCSKSDTDAEAAICASANLSQLDLELTRLYRLALSGPNMDAKRAADLKQEERDWVRDRAECWKASIGLETCVANAYAFRIHDLREGYADSRSDDANGISSGPLAVACDGLDALVSVVFVNSDAPMASLRWLEHSIALPGVNSSMGVEYESDIWDGGPALLKVKNNEVTFTAPGEAERRCRIEPIG